MSQFEAIISYEDLKDLQWMARRYADGRSSYATGLLNRITDRLIKKGVPIVPVNSEEGIYAEDRMFGKWNPETQCFIKD